MNKTILFLAQKMMYHTAYKKGLSLMSIICFFGIFIGTFALALVTAIMNGFEVTLHKKMQGIHSDIIIQSPYQELNADAIFSVLHNEFPEVSAYSPSTLRHIIISPSREENVPLVALIKGINPIAESKTTTISHKIIQSIPVKKFSQLFNDNNIIIGKQLAHTNNLTIGDSLEIFFAREQQKSNRLTFDSYNAIVSGIFSTGIDEFDSSIIYGSLQFLEKLFSHAPIEQINIALKPNTNETVVINKLQQRFGLHVFSWKNLYPALVATLTLEKYVSFFILTLILLVASMNIVSLLLMYITQKRTDIALLKSMGMSNAAISSIFFILGMTISVTASLCGIFAAYCTSLFLNYYPFIRLPDTYLVSHLPVSMNWHIALAVFCTVLFLSFFATLFATHHIKSINVSHVLRFEK